MVSIDPNRSMLWTFNHFGSPTWAWGLYPLDDEHTRLVTRLRIHYNWLSPWIIFMLVLVDAGDFVMMRKCMLGIKRRAEELA